MNTTRLILALAAFSISQAVFGTTTIDGGPMTLTSSPVALSTSSFKVNYIMVKVVPGQLCKVYVGKLGHDKTSLTSVFSVLTQNPNGGHSDYWDLQDPRAADGIDLAGIAVSGDCPGEQVTYMYFQTGNFISALRNFKAGPAGNPAVGKWQLSTQSQTASVLAVRVIPGNGGKINLYGGVQAVIAILYPATGNVSQNNSHAESFKVKDFNGGEHIRPYQMYMSPDIQGEQVLVEAWTVN